MTKKIFMMEFGENLQSLLDDWGMTQQELADDIKVSKQTISAYVCGTRMPSIENLINISHVLDCELNELIIVDEMIEC